MLTYIDRKIITERFHAWAATREISSTPQNILYFLELNHLIDDACCKAFIDYYKKESEKIHDNH